MNLRNNLTNRYLLLAYGLIVFNLWHNTTRSIWDFSVQNSLTIGPQTLELAQSVATTIQPHKPYDGQFYFAMTFDPFLITQKTVHFVDVPIYRYKRMLYPLFSFLCAGGQPMFFPITLLLVNILSWLTAGWAAERIAAHAKFPKGAVVLGAASVTGLTFSTFRTLTEPLAFTLVLWGIYFWLKERRTLSCLFFALMGLARESYLVVPVTITMFNLWQERKFRTSALFLLLVLAPAFLWSLYLRYRLPGIAYSDLRWFNAPFVAFFKETLLGYETLTTKTEMIRTFSITAATVLLSGISLCLFWSHRTFWGALTLGQTIFCSLIQGEIWNYYAGSSRAVILLMVFSLFWFFEMAQKNADAI